MSAKEKTDGRMGNVIAFRVRLRVALVPELRQMHQVSGSEQSLGCYIGELLETCVAEWRKIRLVDGARVPVGPPFARVADVESRFEKLSRADRRQIHFLRTVQGLSVAQIAERYNVARMTVRRIVTEK